jgi:hypothetical protein
LAWERHLGTSLRPDADFHDLPFREQAGTMSQIG